MKLKKSVIDELKELLLKCRCDEAISLLSEIGKQYKSIDKYFDTSNKLDIVLRLGPEIHRVLPCFKNDEISVDIDVYGVVEISAPVLDGEDLCDDLKEAGEEGIDDYNMVIKIGLEDFKRLLKSLVEGAEINWIPRIQRRPHVNEVLGGKINGAYRVKLEYSVDITTVELFIRAKKEFENIVLDVHYLRLFSPRRDEVINLVEHLYHTYEQYKPTITIILSPTCW